MQRTNTSIGAAEAELLREFGWNPWFHNTYWPENQPRVRRVAEFAIQQGPAAGRRVLEVGCANGFVACLFNILGFTVDACDAYDDERRAAMYARRSIQYRNTNLNAVTPLGEYPDQAYDVVLLGEVFEHILNQPAGLLRSIHRILRPGGLLVLTTPNPSTLANAVRVLRDRYVLWGTDDFINATKLSDGGVIDKGDIHYREYPAHLVARTLESVGFRVNRISYIRSGPAPSQPIYKRAVKGLLRITGLQRLRLLCTGYVISATRPV